MLFNSIDFAIFLPIVFFLYWFVTNKNLKLQNLLIAFASYVFYGWWDWRFLFLLVFSTLLDYFSGIQMEKVKKQSSKKIWFWSSVIINLGFLGVFKYFNFFAESFEQAAGQLGFQVNTITLQVILPVGISFYTFHGLSYVIDIYKNRIKAEKNFIDYSVFVSFFPLLVAGPIERATHLLPQFKKTRQFNYLQATDGLRQIIWGLFKKVVIADSCAVYANQIFNNSTDYGGAALVLGALLFTIQIYGDFSGYSDIALGTARLFGIELLQNFKFPYFSRDIAEFWRRWHISLSTWFRDYVYIPLGGSKGGTYYKIRNTFIIFLLSGFWHGANWTFIIWGLLNALYFLPLLLANKNRNNLETIAMNKTLPSAKEFFSMLLTFGLTVFAWIFFRAEDLTHALQFISEMFSGLFQRAGYSQAIRMILSDIGLIVVGLIIFFFIVEWKGRSSKYAIEEFILNWSKPLRYSFYYALIFSVFWFGGKDQEFIYFQF